MWGDNEFDGMAETLHRVYPDRSLEPLVDSSEVYHTLYDLTERYQVSGQWSRGSGVPYLGGVPYGKYGTGPRWYGLFDDKKRMTVGVWVNNDTGDSWEWADEPTYPERYSAMGIRIMLNHIVYALSH
jgi:hypothetical protein